MTKGWRTVVSGVKLLKEWATKIDYFFASTYSFSLVPLIDRRRWHRPRAIADRHTLLSDVEAGSLVAAESISAAAGD